MLLQLTNIQCLLTLVGVASKTLMQFLVTGPSPHAWLHELYHCVQTLDQHILHLAEPVHEDVIVTVVCPRCGSTPSDSALTLEQAYKAAGSSTPPVCKGHSGAHPFRGPSSSSSDTTVAGASSTEAVEVDMDLAGFEPWLVQRNLPHQAIAAEQAIINASTPSAKAHASRVTERCVDAVRLPTIDAVCM